MEVTSLRTQTPRFLSELHGDFYRQRPYTLSLEHGKSSLRLPHIHGGVRAQSSITSSHVPMVNHSRHNVLSVLVCAPSSPSTIPLSP